MNDLIAKITKIIEENFEKLNTSAQYSDEVIDAYEKELNVKFPDSYRYFLKNYGYFSFDSFELYGIDDISLPSIESESIFDVKNATKLAREDGYIDENMIAIAESGYGTLYSIDLSSIDDKGESPIVETNCLYHEYHEKEIIALNTAEFILDSISPLIEEDCNACQQINYDNPTDQKATSIKQIIDFILAKNGENSYKLGMYKLTPCKENKNNLYTNGLLCSAMTSAQSFHSSISKPNSKGYVPLAELALHDDSKLKLAFGKHRVDVESLVNGNLLREIQSNDIDITKLFSTLPYFSRFFSKIMSDDHQTNISSNTDKDMEQDELILDTQMDAERIGYSILPCNGVNLLHEDEIDFTVSGLMPLTWQRVYCSNNSTEGLLGLGWRLAFENYLTLNVNEENNEADIFYFDILGELKSIGKIKLKECIVYADDHLYIYWCADNQVWLIDRTGKTSVYMSLSTDPTKFILVFQVNLYGNVLAYHYDDLGRLVSVDDGSTNWGIEINYHPNTMRIANVVQKNINKLLISYSYNQLGYLTKVVDADNFTTHSFDYCEQNNYKLCFYQNILGLILRFSYAHLPNGLYHVIENSLWDGSEKLWGISLHYNHMANSVFTENTANKKSYRGDKCQATCPFFSLLFALFSLTGLNTILSS